MKRSKFFAALAGLLLSWQVQADGAATAQAQCASCHALAEPDFAALGIAERLERQAPAVYRVTLTDGAVLTSSRSYSSAVRGLLV